MLLRYFSFRQAKPFTSDSRKSHITYLAILMLFEGCQSYTLLTYLSPINIGTV